MADKSDGGAHDCGVEPHSTWLNLERIRELHAPSSRPFLSEAQANWVVASVAYALARPFHKSHEARLKAIAPGLGKGPKQVGNWIAAAVEEGILRRDALLGLRPHEKRRAGLLR